MVVAWRCRSLLTLMVGTIRRDTAGAFGETRNVVEVMVWEDSGVGPAVLMPDWVKCGLLVLALGAAYRAKEDFFAIYDAMTVQEGITQFGDWAAGLAPEIKDAFYPLTRAVNNWMPEFMAYFDHRVMNAYTESLNNLIPVMNRLVRGYSFEALRELC